MLNAIIRQHQSNFLKLFLHISELFTGYRWTIYDYLFFLQILSQNKVKINSLKVLSHGKKAFSIGGHLVSA